MRRQRLIWSFLVVSILFIAYGTYFSFRKFSTNKVHFYIALTIAIIGALMLATYLIFYLIDSIQRKNVKKNTPPKVETVEEPVEEVEEPKEEKPEPKEESKPYRNDTDHVSSFTPRRTSSSDYGGTVYVKRVGYGPVLEISGNRIRDMRNNTYYRIDGNYVYCDSGGLVFEISSNRIRHISGGYLYEISGSSINKIYGGFYASISGNYITLYDSSEKYEITDSLSRSKLLVMAALLFKK